MSSKDLPKWMQHANGDIPDPTPDEIAEDSELHHRLAFKWLNNIPLTPEEKRRDDAMWEAISTYYQDMGGKLSRIDWKRVFIVAVIAVNVLAVIYGLSKIGAAFAIGGAVYAVVTGGTTAAYMLFFAAFAVVMIRKYEGYAMLATVMTLLCAFVI